MYVYSRLHLGFLHPKLAKYAACPKTLPSGVVHFVLMCWSFLVLPIDVQLAKRRQENDRAAQ